MKALLVLLAIALGGGFEEGFEKHFTGATLRLDFFHSGTAEEEHVSAEELRAEGAWPGSRTQLIDDTDLGKYLFEIRDEASGQALFSRGFASIYGEWETTGEALKGTWRTFHESLRFPEPKGPFVVTLKKRGEKAFDEIYRGSFDPSSRFVNRSPIEPHGTVWTIFENGPPSQKVDVLLLGDGFAEEELDEFRDHARRLSEVLLGTEPFASRRTDFNVRAIDLASPRSGVTDPREGRWLSTPLGLAYNAFDSERYMLTQANKALREIAAQAPYDALILLANSRKYGGGGIFNLWCTAAAKSSQAAYLIVHEFGHSFAGLADEYYTSQVAYETLSPDGFEPWEPNVTALLDPSGLKWKDLVASTTPLPTPWDQAAFDQTSLAYEKKRSALREKKAPEEDMEALFEEVRVATTALLSKEKHLAQVGAFEGACYQAKGLYRSELDCIMFTRNPQTFCRVCTRAVERVIDLYAR